MEKGWYTAHTQSSRRILSNWGKVSPSLYSGFHLIGRGPPLWGGQSALLSQTTPMFISSRNTQSAVWPKLTNPCPAPLLLIPFCPGCAPSVCPQAPSCLFCLRSDATFYLKPPATRLHSFDSLSCVPASASCSLHLWWWLDTVPHLCSVFVRACLPQERTAHLVLGHTSPSELRKYVCDQCTIG